MFEEETCYLEKDRGLFESPGKKNEENLGKKGPGGEGGGQRKVEGQYLLPMKVRVTWTRMREGCQFV